MCSSNKLLKNLRLMNCQTFDVITVIGYRVNHALFLQIPWFQTAIHWCRIQKWFIIWTSFICWMFLGFSTITSSSIFRRRNGAIWYFKALASILVSIQSEKMFEWFSVINVNRRLNVVLDGNVRVRNIQACKKKGIVYTYFLMML